MSPLVKKAYGWAVNFSLDPLKDTLYAKSLGPILSVLVKLAESVIPWKVRLAILFTGKIPHSYIESLHDDVDQV